MSANYYPLKLWLLFLCCIWYVGHAWESCKTNLSAIDDVYYQQKLYSYGVSMRQMCFKK